MSRAATETPRRVRPERRQQLQGSHTTDLVAVRVDLRHTDAERRPEPRWLQGDDALRPPRTIVHAERFVRDASPRHPGDRRRPHASYGDERAGAEARICARWGLAPVAHPFREP